MGLANIWMMMKQLNLEQGDDTVIWCGTVTIMSLIIVHLVGCARRISSYCIEVKPVIHIILQKYLMFLNFTLLG